MIVLGITVTTSSLLVARSISKPLDELTKGAEIIGKGGLKHRFEVKTKDEFGQLAAAFNKMTGNLKKITASRDELDREVAERKRAEEDMRKFAEQLKKANTRLQEMDRLKSVFLASMSHELRTPLNSIIGFTGIILQGMSGEVSHEQRKQLSMVKNSASHLLSLINEILDMSKIEAGKVKLTLEEFSLNDVAREVMETLSPTANEKGLELMTEMPEGITLSSDRRRLKQILMNLVSNAVKFTDRGSVKITARVLGDENLEARVIDTGIGIKKEDMNKLFLPFQQVGASLTKKHEGTGLGLHLSKKLADLLGGDISAKSEYGRGSEFVFTIPLRYQEGNRNEEDTGS
jgi:signal transduction histidine kinase